MIGRRRERTPRGLRGGNGIMGTMKQVMTRTVLVLGAVMMSAPAFAGSDRVKMFMKDLTSPVGEVRAGAALALGEAGDPRAVKPLQALLTDEYVDVRKAAAWSLGELGDKSAGKPLSQALQNDKASQVRAAVATALGKIKDPSTG